MAYKLKRIGKRAYKFEYTLTLHSLAVEVSRPKFSPNHVSVAFSRRGKRLHSKLLKWEPSINKPTHGYVVWPEPEPLTTVVTLYKGAKDKNYECKEWDISIIEVTREGKKKLLGKKGINMSQYTGDVVGNSQDIKLRLDPSGRRMKSLSVDCSLNSRFIRAGKSTDADMHSQTSQMSASGLSYISDTEDLDIADLNDLDLDLKETETLEHEVIQPSLFSPPKYIQQEDLLVWSRKCIQGYHGVAIHNFTTSWRSGLAFSAVIHHFHPELLDYESLDPNDVIGNNKKAFDAASSLGVPRIIHPQQMHQWLVPDRLAVTALIYQLYIRLESEVQPADQRKSCSEMESDTMDLLHVPPSRTISSPSYTTEQGDLVGHEDRVSRKQKRLLPTTPAPSTDISPETRKRVKDFLSNLDHSPRHTKNDVFNNYREEKIRKSRHKTSEPSQSPFFGRKAERKMRALSHIPQEKPYIPDEVGRNSIVMTDSMMKELNEIDNEFDTQDLFDNTLLNRAERELTPSLGRKPTQREKTQFLKEMASIGKSKPQESLLDVVSDPAILHEIKQLPKRNSKKNLLNTNPLYQEGDGLSSSDTSISDPATAVVPSKLTSSATPCVKLRDNVLSCLRDKEGRLFSCEKSPGLGSKKVVKKAGNDQKTTQEKEMNPQKSVKKLDEVRARIKSRKKPNRKRALVKECEAEHTLILKRYASVSQMETMDDYCKLEMMDDECKSDVCLSDQEPAAEYEPTKPRKPLFKKSSSYCPVTERYEKAAVNSDNEEPSPYSHLLSDITTKPTSPTSSNRLLDVYNNRFAPSFIQHKDPQATKQKEPQVVKSREPFVAKKSDPIIATTLPEPVHSKEPILVTKKPQDKPQVYFTSTTTTDTEDNGNHTAYKRLSSLSLSEACQLPTSSLTCSEETDYVAHMQKKLCSMQISIQGRQANLRDRIREAESASDTQLHDQLLEEWFQLVQQKAQLDNRYDDLIHISEARDLGVKEALLRKELEHKMQIDRSIKSREQIWEEEILVGEIVQIGKERKELQDELNASTHLQEEPKQQRLQHYGNNSVEVKPKQPVQIKTEPKSKASRWNKLLDILA